MGKLRWGIIGAGGIADRRSIPGMLQSDNCSLSVVMDVKGADELGKKYGVPATDKFEEVLAREDVDAVYIGTPVYLHPEQVTAAAKAGKHVLCEKPLAKTVAEARPMVDACRKAGVLLAQGYMMRYHGAHEKIASLIKEGAIGKPVFARAQLSCWYPKMENNWRQDPERGGGGSLIDMASHLYDLLEVFIGRIKGVTARTATLVHDYPVEDSATTLLEFESGAQAVVDSFFCIPDAAVKCLLEVYGSQGAIYTQGTVGQGESGEAEILRQGEAAGYDAQQQERAEAGYQPIEYTPVNTYGREFDAFAERVAAGEKTGDEDEHLHILAVVEAAYESAQTGKFVKV